MSETSEATFDPYRRSPDAIILPPKTFGQILKKIGPGLILAASIVGTGELIATTLLGLEAGFHLLWLVIISCFIKVFVQIELGRYALASGRTTLGMMREIPKLGVIFIWWWLIMMLMTQNQIGLMIGGSGYALSKATGLEGATTAFAIFITILTIVLLVRGTYRLIEGFTTVLVGLFTLMTVLCVILIQWTPEAIQGSEILQGLQFRLPQSAAAITAALTAIGITGVGASELVAYPYWCLEKGYARHVGPTEPSEQWEARANGWLKVMYVDAWLSMLVYTLATIAFYLLGAATLHNRGITKEKLGSIENMIPELARMYQPVLGDHGATIFITVGALIVLYSTLFAATAGNARVTADFLKVQQFVEMKDHQERRKWVGVFCVAFPVLGLFLFLMIRNPTLMVTIGGIAQALSLPMLGGVALFLRYKRLDRRLTPGMLWTGLLWVSLACFSVAAAWGFWGQVKKFLS